MKNSNSRKFHSNCKGGKVAKEDKINKPRNFVHTHGVEFNKAQVHVDRKKRDRDGYKKHKKGPHSEG